MPSIKEITAIFGDIRQSLPIPVYRFFSYFGPPIILLLMLILALGGELFSGNVIGSTHLDNDLSYFLALREIAFYGDSSFPLWNPYLMCGVPLIAEIQSGLFYPPNIVPANYIFRAIYVPEGIHKIVFQFRPTYFTVALVVALMTFLGACVVAVYPKGLR